MSTRNRNASIALIVAVVALALALALLQHNGSQGAQQMQDQINTAQAINRTR